MVIPVAQMFIDFFGAVIDAMPAQRQLALAARIAALAVLVIFDSGSTKWYSDGTGRSDLQPCDEVRAA
jgi:hypothetical protein